MKNKYIDLVGQTFDFPQDEFRVEDGSLIVNDINMMDIIKEYGTPLKLTYLPKISSQIQRAKRMFRNAMSKVSYDGEYHYCYCTKSSQFEFVLEEVLKNNVHIETSSAYDLNLIQCLKDKGLVDKDLIIICNGFKKPQYVRNMYPYRCRGGAFIRFLYIPSGNPLQRHHTFLQERHQQESEIQAEDVAFLHQYWYS